VVTLAVRRPHLGGNTCAGQGGPRWQTWPTR
jgi:hypothetical protein